MYVREPSLVSYIGDMYVYAAVAFVIPEVVLFSHRVVMESCDLKSNLSQPLVIWIEKTYHSAFVIFCKLYIFIYYIYDSKLERNKWKVGQDIDADEILA